MPKVKSPPRGPQWSVANVPTQVRDWEGARIFLEVSRSGSFRAAAQKLGQSVNAVRRTIETFEKDMGVQLLTRYVGGVQLTEEGNRIAEAARRMEEAAFDLLQARDATAQAQGEVRLSVTEGLGTFWLLPYLMRFQKTNPGLVLNMKLGQQPADLLRLEADISVQLQRPSEPDLKVVKLGRLHVIPYASRGYIAEHGRPTSAADLKNHTFIIQSSENQAQWEADYRLMVGEAPSPSSVALRTNSSVTNFWGAAAGGGISFLPTYIKALDSDLVPLDVTKPVNYDIWLVYPQGAQDILRIRKVMDCIIKAYDPRHMPWFRDEFIHPDRFEQHLRGRHTAKRIAVGLADFF